MGVAAPSLGLVGIGDEGFEQIQVWGAEAIGGTPSSAAARAPLGWPAGATAKTPAHSVVATPPILGLPGPAGLGLPEPNGLWESYGAEGEPVRWDSCEPIRYRTAATPAGDQRVSEAVRTLSAVTGFPFVAEPALGSSVPRWGPTRMGDTDNARVWSPVQVVVVDDISQAAGTQGHALRASAASSGIAGVTVVTAHSGPGLRVQVARGQLEGHLAQYKSARIIVESNLLFSTVGQLALLHAWGHVLGLAEADTAAATPGETPVAQATAASGDQVRVLMTDVAPRSQLGLGSGARPAPALTDSSASWPPGLTSEHPDAVVVPRWLSGTDLRDLARTGRGPCDPA